MSKSLVGIAMLLGLAGRAQAQQAPWGAAAGVAVGLGDVGFAIYDLGGERPSRTVAAAEIAFAVPQLAAAAYLATNTRVFGPSSDRFDNSAVWVLAATVPAAMTVHGIYSLWTGHREERAGVHLAPLVVAEGGGVTAFGRF